MQCERCQKRPANVHITQIINGKKHETHLCPECAQEMKITFGTPQFPVQNLTNLLGFLTQQDKIDKYSSEKNCPNCGTTYRKISESGYLGCSECYHHFASQLEPVLRKIHGSNRHKGKIPKRMGDSYAIKREIEELKKTLRMHVENERYEEAASIRDKIKELEEILMRGERR